MADSSDSLSAKLRLAASVIGKYKRAAVALSGGVDSTTLLKIAVDTLGSDNVIAITATDPIFHRREVSRSEEIARSMAVEHVELEVNLLDRSDFVSNPKDRCYHCKKTLISAMVNYAEKNGLDAVLAGENADDGSDYRPGRKALDELAIPRPMEEAGITKEEVRTLAKQWGLSVWSAPANACLASRVPYGERITADLLAGIEQAEEFILSLGFRVVRVRAHGPVARIEVAPEEISLCVQPGIREKIEDKLRETGFDYAAVDLGGYRTGKLNRSGR